ncbi:MAG TPA: PA2779 family protein [Vicinamibacterales bacterium]|nr:PA2779 family protein [Vicinamibacterales bacterium]
MRIVRRSLALALAVLMMAPAAAQAQNHVISRTALDQALREQVSQDRADRDAIVSLLHQSEVKEVAARAGLSLAKAESAVATLQGDELHQLASQARQAENNLAGGASTIVISTTTIIIVLLVVILIVVIAD